MKNILLILVLCSFVSNLCVAQSETSLSPAPLSLPIANRDVLRAYAMGLVNMIDGQTTAPSSDNSASSSFRIEYTGPRGDRAEIAKQIASKKVRISVSDPNDQIMSSLQYFFVTPKNSFYNVFFGYRSFKLVYGEKLGTWSVPPDAGNIEMKLSDYIPLSIPGAVSAKIVYTDGDNELTESLDQQGRVSHADGIVLFAPRFAVIKWELIVLRELNGVQDALSYNLETGNQIPFVSGNFSFAPKVSQFIDVRADTELIDYHPIYETHETSILEASFTENRVIRVWATAWSNTNSFVEYPQRVLIIDSQSFYEGHLGVLTDSDWTVVELGGKEQVAHFSVKAGQKILIRFEWATFGRSQIPPPFSGGKG